MEDYRSNKQTLGESLKDQFVDESQPEQSAGDKQSVGEASRYEKRRQRLIETNRYDDYLKAATARSRKSRSEKEQMLLEKGGVDLLLKEKREKTEKRRLQRDKKRKQEDNALKLMDKAGNAGLAISAWDETRDNKKTRVIQRNKPSGVACSAAFNQLEQANKEASVEAKEVKKHQSILQNMRRKQKTETSQQQYKGLNQMR